MSDKQERYFVVSESELDCLQRYSTEISVCEYDDLEMNKRNLKKAEAACRTRPVPTEVKGFYIIDEEGDPKCLMILK